MFVEGSAPTDEDLQALLHKIITRLMTPLQAPRPARHTWTPRRGPSDCLSRMRKRWTAPNFPHPPLVDLAKPGLGALSERS